MKGFKLVDNLILNETEENSEISLNSSKIKMTKVMITLSDVLRYNGEIKSENVILGSYGIGVISETKTNMFDIEKGKLVYIENTKPCEECYNCKNGDEDKCLELNIAGEDYNGFLSDFVTVDNNKIFVLPDNIEEDDAIFIGQISLAVSIIDTINVEKGDYVAVVGTNNLANIIAQLLIYYQAVPIFVGIDNDGIKRAKDSGIYYLLDETCNWVKDVSQLTGGRMAQKVIYIGDSNISVNRAFSLASYNADFAFASETVKNGAISFTQALKKQLKIYCSGKKARYTSESINLLANKAVNLSNLKIEKNVYENVPAVFNKLNEEYNENSTVTDTVIDL